ncbi:hypothetical protein ACFL6I_18820 [candidate division KSB1 bacterium]
MLKRRLHMLLPALIVLMTVSVRGFSQDYTFEIPDEEDPALLFSGNLDVKWALMQSRSRSPFYRFQFSQYEDMEKNLSQYRLDYYFNSEYRNQKLFFQMKTFTQYSNNDPLDISFYELFGSLNLSPKLSLGTGKKRFIWGKGYAFNPVGYINTEKDPENPDLALAGKSMLYMNYNKSYTSDWLKNFSLSGIVLPPKPQYNDKFASADYTEYAVKFYFLVKNSDIDLMLFRGKNSVSKYGFDFSSNLKSNIEVHGEWSYNVDEQKNSISNDDLMTERVNGSSYLLGLRYLNKFNTTFIFEYYFNNRGLSENQYRDFSHYLNNALESDDPLVMSDAKSNISLVSQSKTLMKEYFYFNVKQAEPFSLVYSSFSIFSIYNLEDRSFLISPRFNYTPYTNFELILWPTFTSGKQSSEFGNKLFYKKIELWLRFYF